MKINFILPSIGDSGGIKVVEKYAELLASHGHDVIIYKSIKAFNMHRYDSNIKNIVHQIYCSGKAIGAALHPGKYDKFILKINDNTIRNADCIIATSWPTAYMVSKLSEPKGKKFYFIQDFEIWDNRILGEESYKLNLNKIVIANWIKERIKNLGVDISDIPVIYNGIDFELYNISRSYNTKEKMHFLMLDHPLEKKGVSYGVRVFNKIKQKFPEVQLKMFGMKRSAFVPDYAEYYENPTRDVLVNLYNESDVFLFPSLEEGWGLTVIEAMASGCAIVGTNTGCLLEIGRDKYNCMKSNPKDVDSMFENVIEIMENDKLFYKLVQHGKETAKDLDWNKALTLFEKSISF